MSIPNFVQRCFVSTTAQISPREARVQQVYIAELASRVECPREFFARLKLGSWVFDRLLEEQVYNMHHLVSVGPGPWGHSLQVSMARIAHSSASLDEFVRRVATLPVHYNDVVSVSKAMYLLSRA